MLCGIGAQIARNPYHVAHVSKRSLPSDCTAIADRHLPTLWTPARRAWESEMVGTEKRHRTTAMLK
jgi:hypothetical protein